MRSEIGPTMSPWLLSSVPVVEPRVKGRKHPWEGPETDDSEMELPKMKQSRATHRTKLAACGGEPVVQWKLPQ
jgi:hypothetical protein